MEPIRSQVVLESTGAVAADLQRRPRRASDLRGFYADAAALETLVRSGDPLIYETLEPPVPETAGHVRYGITVLYPGRVGREYFMTKGHYHARREAAEVYYGLQGRGCLVLQIEDGRASVQPLDGGSVVYVPPGWAHRSVNTGTDPLIFLFAFPADAGHDYDTIARTGFVKLIVDDNGRPRVVDRGQWLNRTASSQR